MSLPRLHVTTDDATLAAPSFVRMAGALLEAGGSPIALHVRGHATSGAALFAIARSLVNVAAQAGSVVLVNDRVDVALCAGAHGVQLGRRSVPVRAARALLPDALIGFSAHTEAESAGAAGDGADFVVVGSIWETATHPGGPGEGTALLEAVARSVAVPVIAIGGVTPGRVAEAVNAGAHGVAVLSGIWAARDPGAAMGDYLVALDAAAAPD